MCKPGRRHRRGEEEASPGEQFWSTPERHGAGGRCLAVPEDTSGCHSLGGGQLLLASRECSSEMLLIILQCIWHPPPRPTSHRVIRPQMSIAKTAGSEEDGYITAIVYVCPWQRTGKWWCPRSLVSISGLPG